MNIFRLLLKKLFVTNNGEQVTVNGEPVYIMGRETTRLATPEKINKFSMYPTRYTEVISND